MFFRTKFELKDYGEEYKDSYVNLRLLNRNESIDYIKEISRLSKSLESVKSDNDAIKQSTALVDYIYNTVKQCFINGNVFDGEKEREMVVEDIDSFPTHIIKDMSARLRGEVEKKS